MLVLIFGILLSFASLLLQRKQVIAALQNVTLSLWTEPTLLRKAAGIITLWCAGAFFLLSAEHTQATEDFAEHTLSHADLLASLLALIAAFLRLWVIENNGQGDSVQGAEGGSLLPHFVQDSLPA